MNAFSMLLQSDWVENVGWTLLHSIWQILLLAFVYALISRLLKNRAATVRYFVGCMMLSVMLGFSLITYFLFSQNATSVLTELNDMSTAAEAPVDLPVSSNIVTQSENLVSDSASSVLQSNVAETEMGSVAPAILPADSFTDDLLSSLQHWLPLATIFWLMGAVLFALRPLWGWFHVRRLKRHGLLPLSNQLQDVGARLAVRIGVKQTVQFLQSTLVEVPTVVGYLRPMILLPASAITGLSVKEIELILAHELAHVRRHDYLINFAQTVIEALLFYHPGMWWVSNQIRQERENCCDDIAVTFGKNRAIYIQALTRLEQQRQETPPIVLTATGGLLLARVRRLLGQPKKEFGYFNITACLTGLALISLVATALAMNGMPQGDTTVNSIVVSSEEQNAETLVGELDQEVSDRIVKVIQSHRLPFITDKNLDRIHNEFRQFVKKYTPENLSNDRKQAILAAIEEQGSQHLQLNEFYPNDIDSLNRTYLLMPDRLKTLKWKLYEALRRGPLNREQTQRQKSQRKYMADYIKSLPENRHAKHKPTLEHLETRFSDPLCTVFDRPLTEEQFEQFKIKLQQRALDVDKEIQYVVPHLISAALKASIPYIKYSTLPFDDQVVRFSYSGSFVTLGFTSNMKFRGNTNGLDDIENSYTVLDTVSGYPIAAPEDVREPGKFSRWLEQHGKGDFGYDDANGGGLFAVRGAKLALLDVKNWIEADAISNRELRAEIKKQDKQAISIKTFYEAHRAQYNTIPPTEFIGPYIGVLNQEGRLSVVCVEDFSGIESISVRTRLRQEQQDHLPGEAKRSGTWRGEKDGRKVELTFDDRLVFGQVKSDVVNTILLSIMPDDRNEKYKPVDNMELHRVTDENKPPADKLNQGQKDDTISKIIDVPKKATWSKPVDGVQVRLTAQQRILGRSDWPNPVLRLSYEAINNGKYSLHLPENGLMHQVEVDGQWYEWLAPSIAESQDKTIINSGSVLLDFEQGRLLKKQVIELAGNWHAIPKGKEEAYGVKRFSGSFDAPKKEDYGKELVLTRGRHQIRLAVLCPSAHAPFHGTVRAVSEIQLVDIDALSSRVKN